MSQPTKSKSPQQKRNGSRWWRAFALACVSVACGGAVAAAEDKTASAEQSPVVVELFTSQGCSSCPPADDLLREIGDREDVIALSFHVDYWNRLGWRDPFSNEQWSQRQQRYARQQASDTVYTPQMVIDGQWQFVGSDRREAERLLAKSSRRAKPVSIDLVVDRSGQGDDRQLDVTVLAASAEGSGLRSADLLVAVVEEGLVTRVGRGENRSRTLHNDHVVRSLQRQAWVPGERQRVQVALDAEWRGPLSLVAFVQELNGLRIFGAARADLQP